MKHRYSGVLLSVFLIFSLFSMIPGNTFSIVNAAPNPTEITSCGFVINEPGYYTIPHDLYGTDKYCIIVNSNNVVIDGMGSVLNRTSPLYPSFGIYINGSRERHLTNITIKNVRIFHWNVAIYMNSTYNSTIENVSTGEYRFSTSASVYAVGILLRHSSHNLLTRNRFYNGDVASSSTLQEIPSIYGIHLSRNSSNNLITANEFIPSLKNTLYYTADVAVELGSSNNNITHNTLWVMTNGSYQSIQGGEGSYGTIGVKVGDIDPNTGLITYYPSDWKTSYGSTDNNTIENNKIYGTTTPDAGEGIEVDDRVTHLKISENNFSKIGIGVAVLISNNTLIQNNAFQECQEGIAIQSSTKLVGINGTVIKGNTLKNNRFGILSLISTNTLISDNYFTNNSFSVLSLGGSNITIQHNQFSENLLGIYSSYTVSLRIVGNIIEYHASPRYPTMYLENSKDFVISGNVITHNYLGVYTSYSNGIIYNNLFNNTQNLYVGKGSDISFNVSKTRGFNVIGGPYIGGNFWANPQGAGFSEICEQDQNQDGICDIPYVIDPTDIDYLPLTYPPKLPDLTVTQISPTLLNPKTLEYSIKVSVGNIGAKNASNFTLILLSNGTLIGNETIDYLGAGDAVNIEFKWKAPKEGIYNITAIADPGYPNDRVIESNESNNELSINLTAKITEESRPPGRYGEETFGVLFDLWNLWTAWFFKNFEELNSLLQNSQNASLNDSSVAEIKALNETGVQLIKEAWQTDDLNKIRSQMWKYVKSPVLWYKARDAYITEKKALELLKKMLQVE